MAQKWKLTGKITGKPKSKSDIHKKEVITQSPPRQRLLMMTNKDKNPIEKQSSSQKKISLTPNKND